MKYFFFLITIYCVSSCSESVYSDLEKPEIEFLSIGNDSADFLTEIFTKSKVKFKAKFKDNRELDFYSFDIHGAADGHRHPQSHVDVSHSLSNEFELIQTGKLKEKDQDIYAVAEIEENRSAGIYHFVAYASDKAGNIADFKQINFKLSNEFMPEIAINFPDSSFSQINPNQAFIAEGVVRAQRGVSKVKFIVFEDSSTKQNIFEADTLYEGNNKEEIFLQEITIPAKTKNGNYILNVLASDESGNFNQETKNFVVL